MWEIRAEPSASGNVKGEQNEQLRYIKSDAAGSCLHYGRSALSAGGGRIRKDTGADTPGCLFNRGKGCEALEYSGDHLYKQGGGRDAGPCQQPCGIRRGQCLGQHLPLPLRADLKEIY